MILILYFFGSKYRKDIVPLSLRKILYFSNNDISSIIIQSPNFNDTLIVKDKSNNGICIREQKYLHQISIRELHNDFLSNHPIRLSEVYDKEGKPLISDTAFRSLLPRNFQPMSNKYEQMCGYEICIVIKSLQSDLNQYDYTSKWKTNHPIVIRGEKGVLDITEYEIKMLGDGKGWKTIPADIPKEKIDPIFRFLYRIKKKSVQILNLKIISIENIPI